ncbi:MAG TPA: ABC transporter substrate-binding protein [Candidatus Enterocloster excrementipullorum]|uniref:ABC transporter substrate-binding protein n=1 Tax=Candidatus Enterocloster excrementipullorum TaxID=2838559 RepID=A0A9D2N0I7_9FIRM|nr:ABC transporter substrate-binding protein [Candidatus Enterocloster excrementipullorum]
MKKTNRRYLGIAALIAVSITSICGCSGNSASSSSSSGSDTTGSVESSAENAEEITLRFSWWGGDARHQATQEVIELYESQNPGVTIVGEYMGLDGYKEKLMTQLAGNTAPDIMQVDVPWIADLNQQFHSFADINQYSQIDQSGFDPSFVEGYGMYDGILVGLPSGVNCVTMLLNTDVMEKFGIDAETVWNWDNLLEEGQKVNQQDPASYFLCIDQYSMVTRIVQPYLKQTTGNQLVNEDYTMGFTREDLVDLFSYIRQLFDLNVVEPAAQSFMFKSKYQENPLWMNQQACASLEWVASMQAVKEHFKDHADVTLPPIAPDNKNTGLVVRPAHLICINSNSAHPEEAAKFLDFFFNDEEAIEILKDNRSVPPTEKALEICNEKGLLDPLTVKAVELGEENQGMVENAISGNMQLQNIMIDTIEQLGFGEINPEEAADYMIGQFEIKLEELKASS